MYKKQQQATFTHKKHKIQISDFHSDTFMCLKRGKKDRRLSFSYMFLKSIKSKQVNKRLSFRRFLNAHLLMYIFLHIFVGKNLFTKKIKRLEIPLIISFIILLSKSAKLRYNIIF